MSNQTRVILITGASGGIGRACAVAVSKAFSNEQLVLVLSGRKEDQLAETAKLLEQSTVAEIVVGDVSKDGDVAKMFATVKEKYGRLDLLFNNAGVDLLNSVPLEQADMTKFRQVLEVNVMAAVLCTSEAIKLMRDQSPQGGRVVNNGSIATISPRPDSTAYAVSKHAILGLSRCTSLDGRKYGISCTHLDIGNAQTAMGGHAAKGCKQADGSIKSEPMMDVENVGRTLAYLAALPTDVDVQRLEISARGMPYIGRG